MKYIGVIDCNNFFVSCERLFRPDLRTKPVLVLSGNDGCVVARSQEVKDMGIMMGVPIFQIKDIIKDKGIVTFSSHFALYRDISSRVFKVVKSLLPTMEIYSVDEAFFTIEADCPVQLRERLGFIKTEVERQVGIPVSLGVAASKTQAKYANKLAKKSGGVVVLENQDWQKLTAQIPIQDIWGVGGKLERRYKESGLNTVGDLISCPRLRLDSLFGINGLRLQAELSGTSVYTVQTKYTMQQSIMSSRSFAENVLELPTINDAVAYHVRQVVAELKHLRLKTKQITVSLGTSRHGDYLLRGGSATAEIVSATDDVMVLTKQALALVEEVYEKGVPYKKAGVHISNFCPNNVTQKSLFETAISSSTQVVSDLVDELNIKYGNDQIVIGKHTKETKWQSKSEKRSPAYTTSWSDLAHVKS